MLKDYSIKIKELRRRLHLTQHALADRVGVRPATVGWWEQGRWEPSGENYVLLSRLSNPEDAWFFLAKIGVDKALIQNILPPLNALVHFASDVFHTLIQVPLLGEQSVLADFADFPDRQFESFIPVPAHFLPKEPNSYYGFYCIGDSMQPVLFDHFIVVLDHSLHDSRQLLGRMIAIQAQGEVMIRWLDKQSSADHLILRSQNSAYADMEIESSENFRILGEVVFWWGFQQPIESVRS